MSDNDNTRCAIFKAFSDDQMKSDQLYQELKDLAERMQITVSEQNLRAAGFKVKSGLCTVKGQNLFIMDKHKSIRKKISILAAHLAAMPHEDLYIIPAVRDLLDKYRQK
ncbi:MAG: hypothetical protein PVI71_08990 [Desulfobacterales bacterium]|jgi:hypothetical protein